MTDTNQDPNYQDILTKYADSLKSTEVPKIPDPEAKSQASPETQLDSVPEDKPEAAPDTAPTTLEPDPEAEDIPDTEPETAVMTEADVKTEVTPIVSPKSTDEGGSIVSPKSTDEGGISASDMLETEDQVVTPPPVTAEAPKFDKPEAPKIAQPDVQVPPSMMETPPVDTPPSSPVDDFVPPSPHNIEIAPDLVPPPKENHFFKYLFFFSLVVFLVVLALVGYSFINSQQTLSNKKATPTMAPPTGAPEKMCQINGQEYAINETFTATDGCNTCSCTADLSIVCTEKSCDASKSALPSKPATTSAIPADWKIYSNQTYSFKYPSKWNLIDLTKGTQVEIYYQPDKTKPVGEILVENMGLSMKDLDTYTKSKSIGGLNAKCKVGTQMITWCYLISDKKEYISFTITEDKNADYNLILDQILSTFKFTTPAVTTTPKATIIP